MLHRSMKTAEKGHIIRPVVIPDHLAVDLKHQTKRLKRFCERNELKIATFLNWLDRAL